MQFYDIWLKRVNPMDADRGCLFEFKGPQTNAECFTYFLFSEKMRKLHKHLITAKLEVVNTGENLYFSVFL